MLKDIFLMMNHELSLGLVLLMLLLLKVSGKVLSIDGMLRLVNGLLLLNLAAGLLPGDEGYLFHDMFHSNSLVSLEKNILNLGTLIISLQAYPWLSRHEHPEEFYFLLLSTLLGMFFMISSNNLLMFYLGLELSTIPLAALANFDLDKRQSSEAALKFIISSAFYSGLLLLGISLVYGTTGSLGFAEIVQKLDDSPLQLFAFILLLAGFGFKISVVPFHLWTADVYEGSPVVVTSYLSVISKGSIFFVLVPVLFTVFKPLADSWYHMLVILSVLTMIIGNLFALRQDSIKRMLAFSSITQVGFILVGVSGSSQTGAAAVVYFVLVYIFSNLGAFGVVALVSAFTGKEKIEDYNGLYSTNPFLSWVLAISLFSLAGIPPTAGFFGKFFLLMAGAEQGNYALITVAALNMIVSLYYYLRIIRAVFMEKSPGPIPPLTIPVLSRFGLLLCAIGIALFGLWGWIYHYIYSLSSPF